MLVLECGVVDVERSASRVSTAVQRSWQSWPLPTRTWADRVFATPTGRPQHNSDYYERVWTPLMGALRKQGAAPFRFHDLRHTHVAWLSLAECRLPQRPTVRGQAPGGGSDVARPEASTPQVVRSRHRCPRIPPDPPGSVLPVVHTAGSLDRNAEAVSGRGLDELVFVPPPSLPNQPDRVSRHEPQSADPVRGPSPASKIRQGDDRSLPAAPSCSQVPASPTTRWRRWWPSVPG